MMKMVNDFTFTVTFLTAFVLAVVSGSPYVISDERVRSLDITPTLGRGYSVMTNSYQSTCLVVANTTVPSYNYDYSFHDFTSSTNFQQDVQQKMSYSFGYWWFKGQINSQSRRSTNTSRQTHYITAVMRIERYYSSVREDMSPLADAAVTLLNRQDYVGFFKACGPTYIRSIRRAQEVTASFSFTSTSTTIASSYANSIRLSSPWSGTFARSSKSQSKYSAESQSLQIKIVGYGMGLTEEGSETLVATSLPEFQNVMIFAFNSMTKNKNAIYIGMVYGMEVVPWPENVVFQVAAGILDEALEMPLPRSLIPKAFRIDDPTDTTFVNDDRALFRCKEPTYEIDRHGYCCEYGALYDYVEEEYDGDDAENRICKPRRVLDKAIVKNNMAINGEFVARLDRAIRYKMNQLSQLEKCLSAVRNIPERFDGNILKHKDSVQYDETIDASFTVFELKVAIDPFNDFSMLTHMSREVDEWIDMFYSPCLAALFGSNVGTSSDTDASMFMVMPWHEHDECIKLSCLANNMRWDRSGSGGGCIPSMMAGNSAAAYSMHDSACSKDTEYGGETERCKHDSEMMWNFHQRSTQCWRAVLPTGRVDYFMDRFCLPDITGDVIGDEDLMGMQQDHLDYCGETGLLTSNTPSTYPSIYPSNAPSKAPQA